MGDAYGAAVLPSHAIYPSGRLTRYAVLLVVFKCLRSFGLFLSYDILKLVHVVQFLFIVKLGSSLCLVVLQKPFSVGKSLSKHQYFRIAKHAFVGTIINLLWMFGLTLCGPLRTIMLFEHSDLVVLAGAGAIFAGTGGPSKMRGAVFFLLAVFGILFFDHDEIHKAGDGHAEGHHSGLLTHIFTHIVNVTGMSDHMGGVALLFSTLCLSAGFNSASKKLSLDIGGAKRLNAMSSLFSCLFLFPWAAFIYLTKDMPIESTSSLILPFIVVIVFVFLADFYVESVCVNHLDTVRCARLSAAAMFASALFLSCFWWNPLPSVSLDGQFGVLKEHLLSGGVVFSFVLFLFAVNILTGPNRGSRASFIGYGPGGEPLYSYASHALQRTSHSVYTVAKTGLTKILSDSDSRKIFYFLCINLAFTFVELVYGAWTNSLGLISDGFHMLFDCSALVMGLYAAVMSKWKATRIFSYGYDRFEVLSGYINGLFLVVIAFFVFTEALVRVFDPPTINTDRLFTVSVAGLVVNLIGIFAFSHAHSHGGGHGHSHGGGHGHSHGGGGHGHSHGGQSSRPSSGHGHSHGSQPCNSTHGQSHPEPVKHHNTNMEGVFLHILADTLGSVGVIISTVLIENFGLNIADPICSLFIATMIVLSVIPLLKETAMILVLRTPSDMQAQISDALHKVLSVEGVISIRDQHFWEHSSAVTCGTLHLMVRPDISEQQIIGQASHILKDIGVNNLTIQVEKEAYYQHLSGLGSTLETDMRRIPSQNFNNTSALNIKAI